MAQNEYIVEDRSFRTEADYRRALRDKETIDRLRGELAGVSKDKNAGAALKRLESMRNDIRNGRYQFHTILGQDFEDELSERIKRLQTKDHEPKKSQRGSKDKPKNKSKAKSKDSASKIHVSDEVVQEELKRQERRRRLMVLICAAVAVVCLGYFGVYIYYFQRTDRNYDALLALKDKADSGLSGRVDDDVVIHYTEDGEKEIPDVLDEYKEILKKNKKLIGWVKIDDTKINYPVMQTNDNEYYLDHNLNQEYDKNGSIFMDKDCDVLKPSTNLIIYGHHMRSGNMFGGLDKYSDKKYYEEHKYIDFDTIYEKGIYEIMYVFRSRVYSEGEVVFKYYQFIDAISELEFDSNMNEMAAVSLYDTGVTAVYGDRLLTLSTCDYQEKNGRFVVVAKKVSEKE